MAIRFRCDECNHKLSAAEKTVGLKITCPVCKAGIVVPSQSTLPPKPGGDDKPAPAKAPGGKVDAEVEQLRTACPADWSPNRQNLDTKMAELQQTLKKISTDVGGPMIPDSLAWVSE